VLACVTGVDEDDVFEPHPKALTRHRVARNKAILDIGSPWVATVPKDKVMANAFD
jgi:hypothetical protein